MTDFPSSTATEEAIARIRAASTDTDPDRDFSGFDPVEDVRLLLAEYDRILGNAQPSIDTETPPVEDLPLYWQGWANAIKLIDGKRAESDAASLRQAAAYEKCAEELRTSLAHSRDAAQGVPDLTDPVVVHANMLRGTIAKPTRDQIKHLYPEEFQGQSERGEPVAWFAEYDGHLDTTIYLDTMRRWEVLGRKITPLFAAPQPASNAYSSQQPSININPLCDLQDMLEIRDFLADLVGGAELSNQSRDAATGFVSILDVQFGEAWASSVPSTDGAIPPAHQGDARE